MFDELTTFQKLFISIFGLLVLCIMVNLSVFVAWNITTSEKLETINSTRIVEENATATNGENKEESLEGNTNNLFSSSEDGIVTKTPNPIIDALVANGGQYLILKMQSFPGLAVYDTNEQKIVHMLRLATDNFLYTAGGDIVLVYFPENNLLQTWSLKTFEELKTKPNPNGSIVTRMTMGHSNDKRALVRYSVGTGALDHAGMYLLDVPTLQEIPLENGDQTTRLRNGVYRDYIHQRTDGTLKIVSEWATSHSPTGLGAYILSHNSWTHAYEHDSEGYIAVGDDGLIYTQRGNIFNSQLTKIGNISGAKLIPGIGGALFLGVFDDGSMQVYASGSINAIGPIGNFPGLGNDEVNRAMSGAWANSPYIFDRHIVFNPRDGYIIFIPPENDRIIQRGFDLKQSLEEAGIDYLVVLSTPDTNITPGQTWQYEIETMSNGEVEFTLEFGPDKMNINNEGVLTWEVPADYSGAEQVVILIENETGEATYHNFELQTQ